MIRFWFAGAVFLFALWAQPLWACGGEEPCMMGERHYHAKLPEGAALDGEKWPVLLYFHGWGRQSGQVIRNQRVVEAARENKMILIAIQGLGRSWSFFSASSRDSEFAAMVLEDAAQRWPIDLNRVIASGFSYGGAMAWRLACERPDLVYAIAPIAGTLWSQEREDCSAPVRIAHVHGLKDMVMDYPFGENGDPNGAVALWLRENDCKAEPDRTMEQGKFLCSLWNSCKSGKPVELCTHPSGHFIPKTWLSYALPKLLRP